jgi:hypothetical protein
MQHYPCHLAVSIRSRQLKGMGGGHRNSRGHCLAQQGKPFVKGGHSSGDAVHRERVETIRQGRE